jgi:hypothetical protein
VWNAFLSSSSHAHRAQATSLLPHKGKGITAQAEKEPPSGWCWWWWWGLLWLLWLLLLVITITQYHQPGTTNTCIAITRISIAGGKRDLPPLVKQYDESQEMSVVYHISISHLSLWKAVGTSESTRS